MPIIRGLYSVSIANICFQTYIKVESISSELSTSDVKVSIINPLEQESRLKLDSRGAGEFLPEHAGMHEIVLTVDDIR